MLEEQKQFSRVKNAVHEKDDKSSKLLHYVAANTSQANEVELREREHEILVDDVKREDDTDSTDEQ